MSLLPKSIQLEGFRISGQRSPSGQLLQVWRLEVQQCRPCRINIKENLSSTFEGLYLLNLAQFVRDL